MPLELAQRTFTVRGLHASSLRDLLMRNARLRVTTEVEDAKGMGAVRVEDEHGDFVGHVAHEQQAPLRYLLEHIVAKKINVRAQFIRYKREAVVKQNGARYKAKCAII